MEKIEVVVVKGEKEMDVLPFDKCRIAVFMIGNCTGGCGSKRCSATENYIIQISDYLDEGLGIVTLGRLFRESDPDECRYPYSRFSVSHCRCERGFTKEKLREFLERRYSFAPLTLHFVNWDELPE